MKKYGIRLFFIFTLILLGGCTINQKNEEQQIVNKAKEETIKYFKEEENVNVTITKHKFTPNDLQTIFISGYVTDDKNKEFSVAVEYANNYHISTISTTKNFELKHD
ncbi:MULTISPECIES: hypothetical protein [Bacillus]|uniref:DUF1433 domain-containing protein n=1 Tax=Bacillus cereus TaxID=1396 RepID=A0A164G569_BACCE|nr:MULTISPECIES: hypothetical protein [Bacillus]MCU0094041.1 DUF1433 domain-containing protein [Bacillus sp. OR9]KZD37179.1 hypothetical protein B4082_2057 [Bacillus cereus]MCU0097372.1 DUF1433 domain-containing protein [Bacillus sp. OR9]MDF2018134.1 DUF1433 domain-containing protein [Bacillus sp. Cr_R3]MDF2030849.1 DUF1433 domain-containing protein [Bacillus sp. Cr_R16]